MIVDLRGGANRLAVCVQHGVVLGERRLPVVPVALGEDLQPLARPLVHLRRGNLLVAGVDGEGVILRRGVIDLAFVVLVRRSDAQRVDGSKAYFNPPGCIR